MRKQSQCESLPTCSNQCHNGILKNKQNTISTELFSLQKCNIYMFNILQYFKNSVDAHTVLKILQNEPHLLFSIRSKKKKKALISISWQQFHEKCISCLWMGPQNSKSDVSSLFHNVCRNNSQKKRGQGCRIPWSLQMLYNEYSHYYASIFAMVTELFAQLKIISQKWSYYIGNFR